MTDDRRGFSVEAEPEGKVLAALVPSRELSLPGSHTALPCLPASHGGGEGRAGELWVLKLKTRFSP